MMTTAEEPLIPIAVYALPFVVRGCDLNEVGALCAAGRLVLRC